MACWNLEDIHLQGETASLISQLRAQVEEFKKHRSRLDSKLSVDEFMQILRKKEQIVVLMSKLQGRAALWLAENTADQARNANESMMSELTSDASNDILFFDLWFKSLDSNRAENYIKHAGPYAYLLRQSRAFKPYTLGEKEEQIISIKDLTGCHEISKLYDIITNRFMFDWNGKKITLEEINQYKQSPLRSERKQAYDLMFGRYAEEQEVLGEIYKGIVNDWKNENLKLRRFASPISVRNLVNDIPDSVVDVLLNVVRKNTGLFQEYFSVKAKLLGLNKMDRYDLYAPFESKERKYSFAECKKTTLGTWKQFDRQAFLFAKKIFDEQHVHSAIIRGKQSGAFCFSVLKNLAPYILLNFVGRLNDLFTTMHEFGHGIHSLAASHQTQFTFHAALPLAETASVFGEMLLSERLIKEGSGDEKTAVLVRQLDGQYATIMRQAYFILFENAAHERIAKGATIDELNEIYIKNLREQFGSAIGVPEIFKHEWKYIPHIHHTPFYCYAYSFGNLLVLALYKMYEQQGKSFVPKYMKLLSYGGSDSPANILKEIGIDIADKKFWQQGFDVVKEELRLLKSCA